MSRESMKPLAVSAAVVMGLLSSIPRPVEAQVLLAQGVRELSEQIATKAKEQQKLRVAVLPFRELEGQPTVLGSFLAEELFTHLVNAGLEIVERSMLDKVLGEIKLDQTGVIDASTAKQVGKVVGVDAVVTGSITDLQSYVAINCRLIDVITGKIFAAAQAQIVKDDDVKKVLATASGRTSQSAVAGSSQSSAGAREGHAAGSNQAVDVVERFRFELLSCSVKGGEAICDFRVTNLEEDRQLTLEIRGTRLIDATGEQSNVRNVALGSEPQGWDAASIAVSGVPLRGRAYFDLHSKGAETAALVELQMNTPVHLAPSKRFRVQFRDIPLTRR